MTVQKVLYDTIGDNRRQLYELRGKNARQIQQQASSVACFVDEINLKEGGGYYDVSDTSVISLIKRGLGENELFGHEKALAYGTGFLVTPNLLLTAAHVVCKKNSSQLDKTRNAKTYILFDYHKEEGFPCPSEFKKESVYRIKKIVAYSFSSSWVFNKWEDWALVKLDRAVTGRVPLSLDSAKVEKNMDVYMLGYPSGIPIKCTENGIIMSTVSTDYFECKLDAFAGNSGSPVCRLDTKEVVGILCEGKPDYIVQSNYEGMGVTRAVPIRLPFIKTYEYCQRVSELTVVKEYVAISLSGFKLKTKPFAINNSGFYLLGRCPGSNCLARGQEQWMYQGRGTFRLEEVMCQSVCITCKTEIVKVLDVGIYDSQYEIEGTLKTDAHIHKKGKVKTK